MTYEYSLKPISCDFRAGPERDDKPITHKDIFIDYFCRYTSGICVVLIGQPLDTVKVRMQTFPTMYKGMIDCLKKTYKRDKLKRGLYAGTVPAIATSLFENTVLMLGYRLSQHVVLKFTGQKKISELGPLGLVSSGCLTAFFSSFFICPMELVKCQLQSWEEVRTRKLMTGQHIHHIGPLTLIRYILRQHSLAGLYSGLGLTMSREMAGNLLYFCGYEISRKIVMDAAGTDRAQMSLAQAMVTNGMAALFLWTMIFPVDVVKSRVQVLTSRKTVFEVAREILRKEGVWMMYNGLKPTLVKTTAITIVLFLTNEYFRNWLHCVWT